MNFVNKLLKAISLNSYMSIEELQDALGEPNRKRVMDNSYHLVKNGFVERIQDEITRLPAYRITTIGRLKLAAREKDEDEDEDDIIRTPPATKPAAPKDKDSAYVGIKPADIPVLGSTKPEKPAMYLVVPASAYNRFESEQAAREHALSNMDAGESLLIACIVATGKKTIVWEEA